MFTNSSVENITVEAVGRTAAKTTFSGRVRPEIEKAEDAAEARSTVKSDSQSQPRKEAKPEISLEKGEKLAEKLEQAINQVHGTEVKFRVMSQAEEGTVVNFAVIDKETGKVLREFPPESVKALAEGSNLEDGQGIFVDAPA